MNVRIKPVANIDSNHYLLDTSFSLGPITVYNVNVRMTTHIQKTQRLTILCAPNCDKLRKI